MKAAHGYSLWLMPEGDLYEDVDTAIQVLAKAHSAPLFAPHTTLLGAIMEPEDVVVEKTRELARTHGPFAVSLERLEYHDLYFRALSISIRNVPQLQNLHDRAVEVFDVMPTDPYSPHVSLLYGDFDEQEKRRSTPSVHVKLPRVFEVASIAICKAEGFPKDWKIIGIYKLGT